MSAETDAAAADIRAELHRTFFSVWRFGSNALVAWRPTSTGIEILTVPKIRLFALKDAPRLAPEDTSRMALSIMNQFQRDKFKQTNELDLSYGDLELF